MISNKISTSEKLLTNEVTDLGGGKFLVRLNWDTGNPEIALSHTETVSADGCDAAVQIAKRSFAEWIQLMLDCAAKKQAA